MGNSLLMKETLETSFGVGFAAQAVLSELRNPLYSAPRRGLYPETLQAVLWAATASHRSPTKGGSDPSITGVDYLSQPL